MRVVQRHTDCLATILEAHDLFDPGQRRQLSRTVGGREAHDLTPSGGRPDRDQRRRGRQRLLWRPVAERGEPVLEDDDVVVARRDFGRAVGVTARGTFAVA